MHVVNLLSCHSAAVVRRNFSGRGRSIDFIFIGGTATLAGFRIGSGESTTASPGPRVFLGVDAANLFLSH
jgi:hypothetical protein